MSAERYQPCYCEENAWHLCADARLAQLRVEVALVTNRERSVALWSQRAAVAAAQPVVWDYHVLLFAQSDAGWQAWDLDCVLGLGIDARTYLRGTFPLGDAVGVLAPSFRLVPADVYRRELCTDRRHMREPDGSWRSPPPAWPPIGQGSNLMEWLDLGKPGPGAVMGLSELTALVS